MAEPFIKMDHDGKVTMAVLFAEMTFVATAVRCGLSEKIVVGTAIGSMHELRLKPYSEVGLEAPERRKQSSAIQVYVV